MKKWIFIKIRLCYTYYFEQNISNLITIEHNRGKKLKSNYRIVSIYEKNITSRVYHFLWKWTNYLTFLCLRFLIYKAGFIVLKSEDVVRIKRDNVNKTFRTVFRREWCINVSYFCISSMIQTYLMENWLWKTSRMGVLFLG